MVSWIVDSYIFETKIPKNIFNALGIEFVEFKYIPFMAGTQEIPELDGPVVIFSTINAARHLKNFYGCYLNELNLRCNVYMSLLGVDSKDFLNHDHLYTTFMKLQHDYPYYYDLFNTDALFMRPNAGIKEFTGNVITRANAMRDFVIMEQLYNVSHDSMILISTPKKINEESRFIIGNSEILGYSRYQVDEKSKQDVNTHPDCVEFVKSVLRSTEWRPDDLFTIDVALTNNGPKIIELNSFSCAGWYAMDEKEIIRKVSNIVEQNYKRDTETHD